MQQRRRDGGRVHLLLGEDRRDRHRVGDEVVAGEPLLAAMRLGARLIGARQEVPVEPVPLGRHGAGQLGRQDRRGGGHSSPASAKLTYRSPPTITWSYTGRSSRRPASTSWRVTDRSSAEGVG